MQSRLKSRSTTWRTSTRSLKPCKLIVLQHAQLGAWVLYGVLWQSRNLKTFHRIRNLNSDLSTLVLGLRPKRKSSNFALSAPKPMLLWTTSWSELGLQQPNLGGGIVFSFFVRLTNVFGASPCQHFTRTLKPAAKSASKAKPSKPVKPAAGGTEAAKKPKKTKKD